MLVKKFLKNYKSLQIVKKMFFHSYRAEVSTDLNKNSEKVVKSEDLVIILGVHSLSVLNKLICNTNATLPASKILRLRVHDLTPDTALDILENYFEHNESLSWDLMAIYVNQIIQELDCISLEHFDRLLQIFKIMDRRKCNREKRVKIIDTIWQSFLIKMTNDLINGDKEFLTEALISTNTLVKTLLRIFLRKKQKLLFEQIAPEQAIDLLTILCEVEDSSAELVEFSILLETIISNHTNFIDQFDLDFLLKKIKIKNFSLDNKHYNKRLIDRIVDRLVIKDVGFILALDCLSSLNSIRHTDIPLLNYLSTKLSKDLQGKSDLSVLIQGLALARYKPFFWNDLVTLIDNPKTLRINYLTLCQMAHNLASLNYYNTEILERIFRPQCRYNQSSYYMWTFCKLWQYLKTLEDYNGPMPTESQIKVLDSLKDIKRSCYPAQNCLIRYVGGPAFVATDLWSRLYHRIDHMISLKPNGEFFKINPDREVIMSKMCIDDLEVPEDCKKILVVMSEKFWYSRNKNELLGPFAMYRQTLEALKMPVIHINCLEWDTWSDIKRRAFIKQEIDKLL